MRNPGLPMPGLGPGPAAPNPPVVAAEFGTDVDDADDADDEERDDMWLVKVELCIWPNVGSLFTLDAGDSPSLSLEVMLPRCCSCVAVGVGMLSGKALIILKCAAECPKGGSFSSLILMGFIPNAAIPDDSAAIVLPRVVGKEVELSFACDTPNDGPELSP